MATSQIENLEDREGETKLTVHLFIHDKGSGSEEVVTSDLDVWISKGGCIAELKAILESQDLLPADADSEDQVVEVRLSLLATPLRDEYRIPESVTSVYMSIRPRGVVAPGPAPTVSSQPAPTALQFPPLSSTVVLPSNATNQPQRTSLADFLRVPFAPQDNLGMNEAIAQNLMTNPDLMRQIMNMPFVRSLTSNPDTLRSIMDANPQMKELRERNPELNHLLNDSELLKQSMEALQNPNLMREMTSNTDRALSNINAVPGGFNALRQVYQTIQEPIWDAALGSGGASRERQVSKTYNLNTDKAPSTAAIPNPWARQQTRLQATPSTIVASRTPNWPNRENSATSNNISTTQPQGERVKPVTAPDNLVCNPTLPESSSMSTNSTKPIDERLMGAPSAELQQKESASSLQSSQPHTSDSSTSMPDAKSRLDLADSNGVEQQLQCTKHSENVEQSVDSVSGEIPFDVQSFFSGQFPLRSLGGVGLPHGIHITGVRRSSPGSPEQGRPCTNDSEGKTTDATETDEGTSE